MRDDEKMAILECRKALGLTQRQVFEMIGVPIRTVQQWEGEHRKCPPYVEPLIVAELKRQCTYKKLKESQAGNRIYKAVSSGLFDLTLLHTFDICEAIEACEGDWNQLSPSERETTEERIEVYACLPSDGVSAESAMTALIARFGTPVPNDIIYPIEAE